jgi:parvulin-like peptidyl-prolyl isomerase
MPYIVNGQPVPAELVREESKRLSRDLRWQSIPDEAERALQLEAAAEQSAIDKLLIEQAAAADPRPIEPANLESEVARVKSNGNGSGTPDDTALRAWTEKQLRIQRTLDEIMTGAAQPTPEQVRACFESFREHFNMPEVFQAAHIVAHVNGDQSEERARAIIQAALADLERGDPFAEVAGRYSDCKDKGGDLGQFPAGHMVPEFETAIKALEPGQRSGVFRTPFGYHIAELRGRTAAGPAAFEQVRETIERTLTFMNRHEVFERAAGELRARAQIQKCDS